MASAGAKTLQIFERVHVQIFKIQVHNGLVKYRHFPKFAKRLRQTYAISLRLEMKSNNNYTNSLA